MKKIVYFILMLGIMTTFPALADLKIGVIDLQKVLQASPQIAKIDANFRKQFQPREDNIKMLGQKLQADMAQLKAKATTMTDVQKTAAEANINKQRNSLQLLQAQFQQDVQDTQAKAMQSILDQIKVTINTLAINGKYDVILQSSSTVFYKPTYDITQQVIKALR